MKDFTIENTNPGFAERLAAAGEAGFVLPQFWQTSFTDPVQGIAELLGEFCPADATEPLIPKLKASTAKSYLSFRSEDNRLELWLSFKYWGQETVHITLSPPAGELPERSFTLPGDYEKFCTVAGHFDCMFVKRYDQEGDTIIARPYGGSELYIDDDDGYMNDEELKEVLANPAFYGWSSEYVKLNDRKKMYCVADVGNSDFVVFHSGFQNGKGEAALLSWHHDRPGGLLPNELAEPKGRPDFGSWLCAHLLEVFFA